MQQKLLLDVVAHLLAQPVAAALELLAEAPRRNGPRVAEIADLPVQISEPHLLHDLARVEAFLREDLDLAEVNGLAGLGHGHGELDLGVAHEQLPELRARLGHLAGT